MKDKKRNVNVTYVIVKVVPVSECSASTRNSRLFKSNVFCGCKYYATIYYHTNKTKGYLDAWCLSFTLDILKAHITTKSWVKFCNAIQKGERERQFTILKNINTILNT